jgi:hypothetical protein
MSLRRSHRVTTGADAELLRAYYPRMSRVAKEDPRQLTHAVAKGVEAVFMQIERMSL